MIPSILSGPLAGVRIIDLTWLLVGAGATRLLATLGAEVVRIEAPAAQRQDAMRLRPPYMFVPPRYQADPEEVVLPYAEQFDRASAPAPRPTLRHYVSTA